MQRGLIKCSFFLQQDSHSAGCTRQMPPNRVSVDSPSRILPGDVFVSLRFPLIFGSLFVGRSKIEKKGRGTTCLQAVPGSCGTSVCQCSVHSLIESLCRYRTTSYTVLQHVHYVTLFYTLIHYFTWCYTILHYLTLLYTLYTILHCDTQWFSHCRRETIFWIMWKLVTSTLNQERRNWQESFIFLV